MFVPHLAQKPNCKLTCPSNNEKNLNNLITEPGIILEANFTNQCASVVNIIKKTNYLILTTPPTQRSLFLFIMSVN